jgi:hypothetical protein
MNVVFTIVAKNYIGLAQVLAYSVQQHMDTDFYIIVADELEKDHQLSASLPHNVLFAKNILKFSNEKWNETAFKYNLVEFCTAIKPSCFQYFFNEKKYKKVIYVDPDIYFFNSGQFIFDLLEEKSMVLTPHILQMQTPFKGDYPDYLFLSNGTFNLGFLGLSASETTNNFLVWWHNRLMQFCFFDYEKGMATDQKWINMIPSFFTSDEVFISFHKGMNVAPWNYHERKIKIINNQLYVGAREENLMQPDEHLIFVHFSGYDYKGFISNQINHKNENSSNYPDYNIVFSKYAEGLKINSFTTFIDLKYSYQYFINGTNIIQLNRRIYRRMLEEGVSFENPFQTGNGTYYDLLKKKKLIDYAQVTADKMTNKSISDLSAKTNLVNTFFIILKNIIGVRKYSIMIRFFRRYFNEENQAFLLDKNKFQKFR